MTEKLEEKKLTKEDVRKSFDCYMYAILHNPSSLFTVLTEHKDRYLPFFVDHGMRAYTPIIPGDGRLNITDAEGVSLA